MGPSRGRPGHWRWYSSPRTTLLLALECPFSLPERAASDLDDDREHHRALAGQLRDLGGEGVVQPLLHKLHLLDALRLAVVERVVNRIADGVQQLLLVAVRRLEAAHDHLGLPHHL